MDSMDNGDRVGVILKFMGTGLMMPLMSMSSVEGSAEIVSSFSLFLSVALLRDVYVECKSRALTLT